MKESNGKKIFVLFLLLGIWLVFTACDGVFEETEDVIDRTFSVAEGGTLNIDLGQGTIDVQTQSGSQVTVKIVRRARTDEHEAKEFFNQNPVSFSQSGSDVTIATPRESGKRLFPFFRGNRIRVRCTVMVPTIYNLKLKTRGGSIRVGDIRGKVDAVTAGGSLDFGFIQGLLRGETAGGSIRLDRCTQDVDLETSGGSISVGRAEGNLRAETSGGSIRIEEAQKAVNVSTAGGTISASISGQPDQACTLETSGGSISLYLAKGIHTDLEAETSGGRVSLSLDDPVQGDIGRQHIDVRVNGGGPKINLHTSGGSIHIRNMDSLKQR